MYTPIDRHPTAVSRRKLGLVSLAVLTFYNVSGGAFGLEDIVRAGGPFYALWGFVLLFVWAIPEALITAELSSAFPEASGSVAWVESAFGSFFAFHKGFLTWSSSVVDNALYPVLLFDCIDSVADLQRIVDDRVYPGLNVRWFFILALTVTLTMLNLRGLDFVGSAATVICIISMAPFVLFVLCGLPNVQPSRWLQKNASVDWRLLLNTFFWNFNYWESSASLAGEVMNPASDYPLGLMLAMLMVFLASFLPILVGTGATDHRPEEWTDGFFVKLASEVAGSWLSLWMMLAAALTNIGMFLAEMSSSACLLAGMAERGILPSQFAVRNSSGVPTLPTCLSVFGVIFLSTFSFVQVVEILNVLYCLGQLIEFAAFLHLRRPHVMPDLVRPYQIPLGLNGLYALLTPPIAFVVVVLLASSREALTTALVASLLSPCLFFGLAIAKRRRWCAFI